MGRPAGWMKELTGRSPMKSPGAPSHRREIEREFWKQVATGITSEAAAVAVGVAPAVGCRWFRHGGGMPPMDLAPRTGRYLTGYCPAYQKLSQSRSPRWTSSVR